MKRLNSRAGWIFYAAVTTAIYQLALMALMSRVVSAEEMGLYSLLLVFSAVAAVVQDGGLANYIVHRQTISRPQYTSLFLLSICLGAVSGTILLLSARWLSIWYEQPSLFEFMPIIALTLLINSAVSPYQATMLVQKRQVALAKSDILSKLTATLVAVILLYEYQLGIKSALIAALFAALLRLLLLGSLTSKAQQPGAGIDLTIITPAFRFGIFQTLALILNQLRTRLDQLIIGKLLGMELLAVYSLAKELTAHPTKFVTPLIQNILFPRLAALQNQAANQRQVFSDAVKHIAWSNLLIYAGMAACAGPLVLLLYGQYYQDAAYVVSILCAYGVMRTIGAAYVSLAQAQGRSDLEFYWNIVATIIMTPVIWFSALTSSLTVTAATLSVVQIGMTYLGFYFFRQFIPSLRQVKFISISVNAVLLMVLISTVSFSIYYN